jgi:hypothetical protein
VRASVANFEAALKIFSVSKVIFRFQRAFLMSVLILGMASLTLLSVSRQLSMLHPAIAPAESNLNEAVQRLLLADELANNDEVGRAGANFDKVITTEAPLSSTSKFSTDLWSSAAKIRGLLMAANRADAVAEAVKFRVLIDQLDAERSAERSQNMLKTNSHIFDWSFAVGILGALMCLALFYVSHRSLLCEVQVRTAAKDSSAAELLTLSEQFDAERQRTAALQKRLMDVGIESKNKMADMFRVTEILESQVAVLKVTLAKNSEKYTILESHLVHKNNEADLLKGKLGGLLEEFDAQIQDRESERKQSEVANAALQSKLDLANIDLSEASDRNQKIKVDLADQTEQVKCLKGKLKGLLNEFEAQIQDRQAEDLERNRQLQVLSRQKIQSEAEYVLVKMEFEELRVSQAKFKATIESDNSVLEWSNKKLIAQVSDLSQCNDSLRSELASTTMRLRQVISSQV